MRFESPKIQGSPAEVVGKDGDATFVVTGHNNGNDLSATRPEPGKLEATRLTPDSPSKNPRYDGERVPESRVSAFEEHQQELAASGQGGQA